MITDTLDNLSLYEGLGLNFKKAIAFINSVNLAGLPSGKTPVEGENIFASVSEYNTKPSREAKWESHRVNADIQIILSGEEKIGFAPLEAMTVSEAYDESRDIMFYKGSGDYVTLKPGLFAIFLPGDAHQPGVAVELPAPVRKVVFKVKM
jgi:biofilm protein TabA